MASLFTPLNISMTESAVAERFVSRDEFDKLKMEPYAINNDENQAPQPKLLDKDKLILVYYFNYGSMSAPKGITACAQIKQMLDTTFDYSVIPLVVPVHDDTPTHIEILNNETLTPKQFEQIKRTEEILKEIAHKNEIRQ